MSSDMEGRMQDQIEAGLSENDRLHREIDELRAEIVERRRSDLERVRLLQMLSVTVKSAVEKSPRFEAVPLSALLAVFKVHPECICNGVASWQCPIHGDIGVQESACAQEASK